MKIRQTNDLDLIQQLDNEWFGEEGFDDYEEAVWWVAYDETTPAAYAGVILWGQGIAFLNRGCVGPGYRGQGLQKHLIRTRLRYLKKQKYLKAITYTSPDNCPSANSLIRCGFKLYTPLKKYGLKNGLYFYKDIK